MYNLTHARDQNSRCHVQSHCYTRHTGFWIGISLLHSTHWILHWNLTATYAPCTVHAALWRTCLYTVQQAACRQHVKCYHSASMHAALEKHKLTIGRAHVVPTLRIHMWLLPEHVAHICRPANWSLGTAPPQYCNSLQRDIEFPFVSKLSARHVYFAKNVLRSRLIVYNNTTM